MSGVAAQVPVVLANDTTMVVHDVASLPAQALTDGAVDAERFGFGPSPERFSNVTKVIEGIAAELRETLDRIAPHSATVEFGLEVTGEPGFLTAALVKGSGTAHLTVTLEWERQTSSA